MLMIWVENVMCELYVMPRMGSVLFSGSDSRFNLIGGCEMDSCLSGVKRMIEDLFGDAHFLFLVCHCSS